MINFFKMQWRDMALRFRSLLIASFVLCLFSGSALLYQRVDTDGDGLGDLDERLMGLDPLNATDASSFFDELRDVGRGSPVTRIRFFSDPLHGSHSVPLPGWLQEGGPGHLSPDGATLCLSSSLPLALAISPVS